jgi:ubiquitin-activating enzyme E1
LFDVNSEAAIIESLLPKPTLFAGFRLQIQDFEKDEPLHMQFVASCANLRAMNYDIPTASDLEAKRIVGKIIPAIATTTALVAGLVCMEIYKLSRWKLVKAANVSTSNTVLFRNSFCNLAIPFITLAEPSLAPKKKLLIPSTSSLYSKARGLPQYIEWTIWDFVVIKGPRTINEISSWLLSEYGLTLIMISFGRYSLYSSLTKPKIAMERAKMELKALVEMVSGHRVSHEEKVLEFVVEVIFMEDIDFPSIKYVLEG